MLGYKEWQERFIAVVKNKMHELNMSQKDLSDKTGITEATISRYLSNIRTPKATNIIKIAEALNCSVSDLMDFEE